MSRHRYTHGDSWNPSTKPNKRLAAVLALLDDAPPGVAEATTGMLTREHRLKLVADGLCEPVRTGYADAVPIEFTARGRRAIADSARLCTHEPTGARLQPVAVRV